MSARIISLLLLISSTLAQSYTCGSPTTGGYKIYDSILVCLFFDQKTEPNKVVFNPSVDRFTSFQIQGLSSTFASSSGNQTITAMSNNKVSPPTMFKIENGAIA
jgi:hypothetical protein